MKILLPDDFSKQEIKATKCFFNILGYVTKKQDEDVFLVRNERSQDISNKLITSLVALVFNDGRGTSKNRLANILGKDTDDLLERLKALLSYFSMDLLSNDNNFIITGDKKFADFMKEELNMSEKAILVYILILFQIESNVSELSLINFVKSSYGYSNREIRGFLAKLESKKYIKRITTSNGRFILLDWKSEFSDQINDLNSKIFSILENWSLGEEKT